MIAHTPQNVPQNEQPANKIDNSGLGSFSSSPTNAYDRLFAIQGQDSFAAAGIGPLTIPAPAPIVEHEVFGAGTEFVLPKITPAMIPSLAVRPDIASIEVSTNQERFALSQATSFIVKGEQLQAQEPLFASINAAIRFNDPSIAGVVGIDSLEIKIAAGTTLSLPAKKDDVLQLATAA